MRLANQLLSWKVILLALLTVSHSFCEDPTQTEDETRTPVTRFTRRRYDRSKNEGIAEKLPKSYEMGHNVRASGSYQDFSHRVGFTDDSDSEIPYNNQRLLKHSVTAPPRFGQRMAEVDGNEETNLENKRPSFRPRFKNRRIASANVKEHEIVETVSEEIISISENRESNVTDEVDDTKNDEEPNYRRRPFGLRRPFRKHRLNRTNNRDKPFHQTDEQDDSTNKGRELNTSDTNLNERTSDSSSVNSSPTDKRKISSFSVFNRDKNKSTGTEPVTRIGQKETEESEIKSSVVQLEPELVIKNNFGPRVNSGSYDEESDVSNKRNFSNRNTPNSRSHNMRSNDQQKNVQKVHRVAVTHSKPNFSEDAEFRTEDQSDSERGNMYQPRESTLHESEYGAEKRLPRPSFDYTGTGSQGFSSTKFFSSRDRNLPNFGYDQFNEDRHKMQENTQIPDAVENEGSQWNKFRTERVKNSGNEAYDTNLEQNENVEQERNFRNRVSRPSFNDHESSRNEGKVNGNTDMNNNLGSTRNSWTYNPQFETENEIIYEISTTTTEMPLEPTKVPGSSHLITRDNFPYDFWRPSRQNFVQDRVIHHQNNEQSQSEHKFKEIPNHMFSAGLGPVAVPEDLMSNHFEEVTAEPSFDLESNPFEEGNNIFNHLPEIHVVLRSSEKESASNKRFKTGRPEIRSSRPRNGIVNRIQNMFGINSYHEPPRPNDMSDGKANNMNSNTHPPVYRPLNKRFRNPEQHREHHVGNQQSNQDNRPETKRNHFSDHPETYVNNFEHSSDNQRNPFDRNPNAQRKAFEHNPASSFEHRPVASFEHHPAIPVNHRPRTAYEHHADTQNNIIEPRPDVRDKKFEQFTREVQSQRNIQGFTQVSLPGLPRNPLDSSNDFLQDHFPKLQDTSDLQNSVFNPKIETPGMHLLNEGFRAQDHHIPDMSNPPVELPMNKPMPPFIHPREPNNPQLRMPTRRGPQGRKPRPRQRMHIRGKFPNRIRGPFEVAHIRPVNPHEKYMETTQTPELGTRTHFDVKYENKVGDQEHEQFFRQMHHDQRRVSTAEMPVVVDRFVHGAHNSDEQYHRPSGFNQRFPVQIQQFETARPSEQNTVFSHPPPQSFQRPRPHGNNNRRRNHPIRRPNNQKGEESSFWSALSNFDLSSLNPFNSFTENDKDDGVERVDPVSAAIPASLWVPGGLAALGAGLSMYYFNYVWAPTPIVRARLMDILLQGSSSSLLTDEQQRAVSDVSKVYSALSDITSVIETVANKSEAYDLLTAQQLVANETDLLSQTCKNRMVCQTYSEFDDLLDVTKTAAMLLKDSMTLLDQDLLLDYFLAADRGHHLSLTGDTCEEYYPECPLPSISVKNMLRDMVGIEYNIEVDNNVLTVLSDVGGAIEEELESDGDQRLELRESEA